MARLEVNHFCGQNDQSTFRFRHGPVDRLYLLKVLPTNVVKQCIVHLDTNFHDYVMV